MASGVAAEPKLTKTLVVPLRLPRNFEPPALPQNPISNEVTVGIVPPQFVRGRSATWTEPIKWAEHVSGFQIIQERVTEIQQVFVDAAEPVAASVPRIFKRLFPRSEVLPDQYCPKCDLVFVVTTESSALAPENTLTNVSIKVSISAVTPDLVDVASYSATSVGPPAKRVVWSTTTGTRGMGEPALQEAIEKVFAKLVEDPALRGFIAEKVAQHSRPSELETTIAFDDSKSLFPNGRLDAGEAAWLHVRVRNHGSGPAFDVRLRLEKGEDEVVFPAEVGVADIPPGADKEVNVPISAGIGIQTSSHQIRVETIEKRGYGGRTVLFELVTERLKRPTLEIADITLDDRGARAVGDGDGRPSNGETLEAVILVRNSGVGDAAGVDVAISSVVGVDVANSSAKLGTLSVNSVSEVRALLHIPIGFIGNDVGITVRAVESRGAAVTAVQKEQHWPLSRKVPQLDIAFRLFDGNSAKSGGNRDGVANNGETVEIALTVTNRGTQRARDVRLVVTSSVLKDLDPSAIDVGDLPAQAEGAEHRIRVTLPRTLGRDGPLQRLPLTVTINQADFPVTEQAIGLPFVAERPDLVANLWCQSEVVEGKPAVFEMDVRNDGRLSAEDVKVDISSDDLDIDLLDAAGVPSRTAHIDIGSIGGDMAAARVQIRALVRRNVATTIGALKAIVSQRDFDGVATHMALNILKEVPSIISAPLPQRQESAPIHVAAGPATISFQKYRDGTRVNDDTIALAFEIQSAASLAKVRFEHNHDVIELPAAMPIRNGDMYLWQYEPAVHLEYGDNEFEVVVVTSEGIRSSRAMTLEREKPRGRIWVATIGVSSYRNPSVGNLAFASDDASAIASYYRQSGIPDEQLITLFDENATLANVKRSLGTDLVRSAINPDDTVLIYFAGHGAAEVDRSSSDGDGFSKYLLPYDVDPEDLFSTALGMEELSRILQRLRAERVVLILDSCFSGAAGGRTPYEPESSRGAISEAFLSRVASTGKGRVILTASGSREVARESRDRQHGIFTWFLLEGLRGAADFDHDGRVDVDEIYRYVSQKVSDATHGLQNPMRKSPNQTGTVILGGRLR